jgi:hypothetical protein
MTMRLLVFVLVAALVLPGRADAWGFEAHHLIMERAIALLPPELRPLFEKHRAKVVERIIDPTPGAPPASPTKEPNHFLDLDWEGYGKEPFSELPRDYTAAVAKFGRARILDNGVVPVAHRGDVREPAAGVSGLRPPRRVRAERHHHFSAWLATTCPTPSSRFTA